MPTQITQCDVCGSDATPLEIEIIGGADTPSEIVDLASWIQCPKCGPRKLVEPRNEALKDTIEFFTPITSTDVRP
jgi:DNA-directed RNA polymerase subunit RPC12/RpoP